MDFIPKDKATHQRATIKDLNTLDSRYGRWKVKTTLHDHKHLCTYTKLATHWCILYSAVLTFWYPCIRTSCSWISHLRACFSSRLIALPSMSLSLASSLRGSWFVSSSCSYGGRDYWTITQPPQPRTNFKPPNAKFGLKRQHSNVRSIQVIHCIFLYFRFWHAWKNFL